MSVERAASDRSPTGSASMNRTMSSVPATPGTAEERPGQLLPEPVQANRVGQVVAQWPAERIDLLLEHRLADASAGVREALQSVFDGVTPRRELPDGQVITTLDRDGGQLPMQIHVVGLKSGQE